MELGCQEGPQIVEKINDILYSFFEQILMDFRSPGAAFWVGCQGEPKGGNIAGASRATKLLITYLLTVHR